MKVQHSCALGLVGFVGLVAVVHGQDGQGTLASRAAAAVTLSPGQRTLDRFLADTDGRLVSYRAMRYLTVVARGGKMTASLTARTSLDADSGFKYEVLNESGSGMLRSRVLHGVLEAESDAKRRERGEHGALTLANYSFAPGDVNDAGLLRVAIHPRRKDSLLLEGSILLTNDDADLVQMEGLLVKRPSFWTRKVQIVRTYGRIGGVRVPLTTGSTADILFAGQSTFSMRYEYQSINDVSIEASPVVSSSR